MLKINPPSKLPKTGIADTSDRQSCYKNLVKTCHRFTLRKTYPADKVSDKDPLRKQSLTRPETTPTQRHSGLPHLVHKRPACGPFRRACQRASPSPPTPTPNPSWVAPGARAQGSMFGCLHGGTTLRHVPCVKRVRICGKRKGCRSGTVSPEAAVGRCLPWHSFLPYPQHERHVLAPLSPVPKLFNS